MEVAALVSGGVDSSVALALAKDERADLRAFYLKVWLQNEFVELGDCPWEEDLEFAASVCKKLGVPLEVVPLQSEYWERVVAYTMRELRAGRTPNPDIQCNSMIKFDAFLSKTGFRAGAAKVITGHYAGVGFDERNNQHQLLTAKDTVKDQTYFLSSLGQSQLALLKLPLSGLMKSEVRAIASSKNLKSQARKDSQGLCFLGKIRFRDFVRYHLGEKEGDLLDADTGERLGRHKGHWFYTIGQRQGLGLSGGPWYVVGKEVASNTIRLSQQANLVGRRRTRFALRECHWLSGPPKAPKNLRVKVRHGPESQRCSIRPIGKSGDGLGDQLLGEQSNLEVELEEPELGIASGQFAVFYSGNRCLGNGVIADENNG